MRAMGNRIPVLALQRCLRRPEAIKTSRSLSSLSQWHFNHLRPRRAFLPRSPRPTVFTHHHPQFVSNISTAAAAAPAARSLVPLLKGLLYGTSLVIFLGLGWYYVTDTRASIHRWLVVPALRWWYRDAEEAHEAGTKALRVLWEMGLHPREREDVDGGVLEVEVSCAVSTQAASTL
jgi:dihydroorotate dehydrogenase